MSAPAKIKKRQPTLLLRVARAGSLPAGAGVFVPNDELSERRARSKGWKTGSVMSAVLKLARRPWFHRKAHLFGQMVADNIEPFSNVDAHETLKRLQLEANVGCETLMVDAASMWGQISDAIVSQAGEQLRPALQIVGSFLKGVQIPVRIPRSLSFESMDEREFDALMHSLYLHVANTYWPGLDAEQVDQMTQLMENAA